MKKLKAFAGKIPLALLVTVIIILNIVNFAIVNDNPVVSLVVSVIIILMVFMLILRNIQKFDENHFRGFESVE